MSPQREISQRKWRACSEKKLNSRPLRCSATLASTAHAALVLHHRHHHQRHRSWPLTLLNSPWSSSPAPPPPAPHPLPPPPPLSVPEINSGNQKVAKGMRTMTLSSTHHSRRGKHESLCQIRLGKQCHTLFMFFFSFRSLLPLVLSLFYPFAERF